MVTDALQMNLLVYMNRYKDKFTEASLRDIFQMIVKAVNNCHEAQILHRDLKPENILVNVDQFGHIADLKLCDFGMSCYIGGSGVDE